MPNIEISEEQAAALARGENVTLSPKPKGRPLKNALVRSGGSFHFVFDGLEADDHIEFYRYVPLALFDAQKGTPWDKASSIGNRRGSRKAEILYEEGEA